MFSGLVLLTLCVTASATPCDPNGIVRIDFPPGHYFTANSTVGGCPCIRKCCSKDEEFFTSQSNKGTRSYLMCGKLSRNSLFENFTVPVYKRVNETVVIPHSHFSVVFGDICPRNKIWLNPAKIPHDRNFLMSDGSILLFGEKGRQIFLDVARYCLESVNTSREIYTFVCPLTSQDPLDSAKYKFYPIGMFLSMPFLLVTFVVYAILPDLRNVHGKSLMCTIASFIAAYISLSTTQLNSKLLTHKGYRWCCALGK